MNKIESEIKNQFPILKSDGFVYLDSAATAQKPQCVLDAICSYYKLFNANAHRGSYRLSIKTNQIVDITRHKVANLLNAEFDEEIIFTKNATESLNLIAYAYAQNNLKAGDEVVLSIMEHHSMIVPFQQIAKKCNAGLKYLYLNNDYQISDEEIENKITNKTKIVGISSVSNVLGTINNVKQIIKKAHSVGAVVVVDISQSIAHMPFNVREMDADFVVFSAHKMYGPTGVGVLYGKKQLLENMPPFLFGGDMIEYVYEDNATFASLPNKFEAGTLNVADINGFGAAIDYINQIGYYQIKAIEQDISQYCYNELLKLPFIELYCTKDLNKHSSVISFNINGVHPHDVASILDASNVYIRSGNHCAQPLARWLKIDSTCRISISIYNTKDDIDKFIEALKKVYEMFKKYI
ncbi:MAG TPA: cysteine desulfurase [Clostridiales bacterium]|nr:cysteine desulfurase [Clostridiales bacterium]